MISPTRIGAAVLLAALASAWAGCGASTRAAVRNDTLEAISVTLRSADTQSTLSFSEVGPSSVSEYRKVPFSNLNDVQVEVGGGEAKGGKVKLDRAKDNTIIVSDEYDPAVDAMENMDGAGW
jgi:hypothetical protein